jgi:hypothetical protein
VHLLSLEEILARLTPLARALGTPERHLLAARPAALEMALCDVRQGVDEDGTVVQTVGALDALVALCVLADDFLVELVQRLDVVGRKRNGDEEHVCLALLHVLLDRVGRLRAEPGLRADLRLPHEAVLVLHAQALHDGVDGRGDLGRVGVAAVDDRHGQRVRREQDDDAVAALGRVRRELGLDVLRHGVDEARVCRPAVNHAPLDCARGFDFAALALALEARAPLPDLVERGARRAARVLRVLRKRDGSTAVAAAKAVRKHLLVRVLGQRVCVAERNVGLVRRRVGRRLVEDLAHFCGLVLGPLADGRPAAYLGVLLLDLGGAAARDVGADVVLKGTEGNEVFVGLRAVSVVVFRARTGGVRIAWTGSHGPHRLWQARPCS